jgi:hypothetical protein
MGKIVDIAINVYGKPYQTLVALKTLVIHSGIHIDKIYFIREKKQPHGVNFDIIFNRIDNLIIFEPELFLSLDQAKRENFIDESYRHSIRYQYAWEKTDKRYLFITHNDVIYNADIIGSMLNILMNSNYVGVGQIGRCETCSAFFAGRCSGDRYLYFNPSYEEVVRLIDQYPLPSPEIHNAFLDDLNKEQPMPLPLCRLNEWACLIDLEKIKHHVVPYGDIDPLGAYGKMDLGFYWFRHLNLKGFKFHHIDINKFCKHGWENHFGHAVLLRTEYYIKSEDEAVEFLEDVLGENLDSSS